MYLILIIIKFVSIPDIVISMTEHTRVRNIDITAEAVGIYKRQN